ncbi:hypothetical protein ACFYU8_18255 [Brevibacillus sp. NPDC003359]|uniref:hypothetical protein n=1 Tax=unclassified Brevibacillus TaxID=2684853 RepID=UPI003694F52A
MKGSKLNQNKALLDHLEDKANRHCRMRYVVFTKKYLGHSFEVLTETSEPIDTLQLIYGQKPRCIEANPRLVFDQLQKKIIAGNNEELIIETINRIVIEEAGKRFYYPFRSKKQTQ